MIDQFDIIIVGGGMVGAALAAALGDSDLRVALIEARAPQPFQSQDEVDLRVSAITQASQRIFAALGAWDAMRAQRISPFREMHVWDAAGSGAIHFDSADIGTDTLGWIIENRIIQAALWTRVQAHANVEVICPALPVSLMFEHDVVRIELDHGRTLTARLAVGADGAQSRVRGLAGIETQGWTYDQQALVATVTPERSHRATAWQRFLPGGPLALLPLADGRCSIVWSTAPSEAERLLALDEPAFLEELTQASESTLGRMLRCGPRAAFPLRLLHAREYVRPRLALIGDAAHCVHPLAGQGVNLGLLDAATLAEVLLDAQRAGRDVGALATLRRYERWRKGENLLMLGVMDGFKRLFGVRSGPVPWVRNLGLALTDRIQPAKNLIMRRAMGLEGDLTKLARIA